MGADTSTARTWAQDVAELRLEINHECMKAASPTSEEASMLHEGKIAAMSVSKTRSVCYNCLVRPRSCVALTYRALKTSVFPFQEIQHHCIAQSTHRFKFVPQATAFKFKKSFLIPPPKKMASLKYFTCNNNLKAEIFNLAWPFSLCSFFASFFFLFFLGGGAAFFPTWAECGLCYSWGANMTSTPTVTCYHLVHAIIPPTSVHTSTSDWKLNK